VFDRIHVPQGCHWRPAARIQEIEPMHMKLLVMTRLMSGIAASTFVLTVSVAGQAPARQTPSPGVPASEKNHFVETPKGWVHPVTAWGDPDIQGMFNFSYVGSVQLQRCGGGTAGTAPPELVARAQAAAEAEAPAGAHAGSR
jgi:hypothetical protein